MKLQKNKTYAKNSYRVRSFGSQFRNTYRCNNTKNDVVIPSSPVVTETQVEVEEVLQTPMPTPSALTISLEDTDNLSNYYKISDEVEFLNLGQLMEIVL